MIKRNDVEIEIAPSKISIELKQLCILYGN